MMIEREQAIRNVLMEYLGLATSTIGSGKGKGRIDEEAVQMAERRMFVNKRRMIIFAVLYAFVVLTAVAAMFLTTQDYNVLIWVGAGTFNAVNAALHYTAYQKKKMAFALLNVLAQDGA